MVADELALTARVLVRADWGWVQEWFLDEQLNQELGPLDEEWLEHVLSDAEGVQLVVHDRVGRPLALAGCVWGSAPLGHGITDFAVHPALRGTGVGRRALEAVLAWEGHPSAGHWIAFVDQENPAAHAFFTAVGWRDEGLDDDMHRFVRQITASAVADPASFR